MSTTPSQSSQPAQVLDHGKWYTIIPLPANITDGTAVVGDEVELANGFNWIASSFFYSQKLADLWMAYTGEAEEGIQYVFEDLPVGYGTALKERQTTKRIDRYVYGHPSGKPFRGTPELWKHFKFLMEWDTNRHSCVCELCQYMAQHGAQGS